MIDNYPAKAKSSEPASAQNAVARKAGIRTVFACALILGASGFGMVTTTGAKTSQNGIANTITGTTPLVALAPGQWEIRQTMTGGPRNEGPDTRTTCLTADALAADPIVAMKPQPPANRAPPNCQLSDLVTSAGAISYQTACSLPFGTMKTNWNGTVEAERFAVAGQAKMMGRTINTQISGTRLGDCPAS
jgi:Protein of unknown function (DUF3617)